MIGDSIVIGDTVLVRRKPEEQARSLAPKVGTVFAISEIGTRSNRLVTLRNGNIEWTERYGALSKIFVRIKVAKL